MSESAVLKKLNEAKQANIAARPSLFAANDPKDMNALAELFEKGAIQRVSDDYEEEQRELFAIRNPALYHTPEFQKQFLEYFKSLGEALQHGTWVLYPWSCTLVHVLPEAEYFIVRTARNHNLITPEEQKKYYDATIGIAGLSVGSSVALAIALQGGGSRMRLADMDDLALTNTNRVPLGSIELGARKVEAAARAIYEINPYADITTYPEGVTPDTIDAFFDGLDIVIDEIDTLAVKCLIREKARALRIPVLMAADNGDNAVVDIERYDLDPHIPFFHGRMGEVSYTMLQGLDKFETGRLITKLVGPENVTERMQASLLEMGKTLVSWPQLGGAALINGAAVAYCARKVLTGEPLEADRALISLDEKLIPKYTSSEQVERRREVSRAFAKRFNIDL